MTHIVRVTEQVILSSLHNLENPNLSDSENERLYGNCYRKHGHDYHLQIQIESSIDAKTGVAVDRTKLKSLLDLHLVQKFSGQYLNHFFDCTSGEALCAYFFDLLKEPIEKELGGSKLVALHMQETRKNWFSYSNL